MKTLRNIAAILLTAGMLAASAIYTASKVDINQYKELSGSQNVAGVITSVTPEGEGLSHVVLQSNYNDRLYYAIVPDGNPGCYQGKKTSFNGQIEPGQDEPARVNYLKNIEEVCK